MARFQGGGREAEERFLRPEEGAGCGSNVSSAVGRPRSSAQPSPPRSAPGAAVHAVEIADRDGCAAQRRGEAGRTRDMLEG